MLARLSFMTKKFCKRKSIMSLHLNFDRYQAVSMKISLVWSVNGPVVACCLCRRELDLHATMLVDSEF
jgi:hypothetical protein